jgi:hypothetical protein
MGGEQTLYVAAARAGTAWPGGTVTLTATTGNLGGTGGHLNEGDLLLSRAFAGGR